MFPFSTTAPSLSSTRLRFELGSPGVSLVCSEMKLAIELKRAILSGVSAGWCQYGKHRDKSFWHKAGRARLKGCKGRQRTCGLFDSVDDVRAGRKHKAQPLAVESGHCGELFAVVAVMQQSVGSKAYAQRGYSRCARRGIVIGGGGCGANVRVKQAPSQNARCKSWPAKSI